MINYKQHLTLSKLFVLIAVIGAPCSTAAVELEEIIVTAQKKEENLMDVPIAIQAITGEFIENAGIDDLKEMQFYTPGLSAVTAASNLTTSIAIRGLGTTGGSIAFESGVGVYVDGIYRARQSSALNDLIDLERVEVLKGPQGTLFGRNTIAGALSYVTKAPEAESGGWAEIQAGNFDHYSVRGAVNVPLIEDTLLTRFSGSWTERDGYVDNVTTGTEANDTDRRQLRAQALYLPSESVSLRVIADYSEIDEVCCANGNYLNGPGDAGLIAAGLLLPDSEFDEDAYASNVDSQSSIEEWGLSAELNWSFNDMTFTSLTAWRSFESESRVDADITGSDIADAGNETEQDGFTQEFRLSGSAGESVDWVVGGYYFDQSLDNTDVIVNGALANTFILQVFRGLPPGIVTLNDLFALNIFGLGTDCANSAMADVLKQGCDLPALPEGTGTQDFSEQEHESWAVFGQVDIDLTDKLIATIGARYTSEEKTLDANFNNDPFVGFLLSPVATPVTTADRDNVKFDDDQITGTVKLAYHWNDDMMTYLSYGSGYKSGGTNIDRLALTPASAVPAAIEYLLTADVTSATAVSLVPQTFDSETSDAYELGLKGSFLERRLNANLAIFYTEFDDLQLNQFDPGAQTFVVRNAASVTSEGIELEVRAQPTDWLFLMGAFAYIDAEYDSFPGGACGSQDIPNPQGCDNSGRNAQGTPEYSASGSMRITQSISDSILGYMQADVSYIDETFYGSENDPLKTLDSRTLVNLRIGASIMDGDWDVSLWGKNIFDEDYASVPLPTAVRPGALIAGFTEPRTYGVSLRVNF